MNALVGAEIQIITILPQGLFAKPLPSSDDLKARIRSKAFDISLDNAISLCIRISIRRVIQDDMGFNWWPRLEIGVVRKYMIEASPVRFMILAHHAFSQTLFR